MENSFSKESQLHKDGSHKTRRKRKCKLCRSYYSPREKWQETCSTECAIAYLPTKRAKEKRKAIKQFKETDKATLMRKAQTLFNRYIRYRDVDLPCISCGHKGNRQIHAGHFMPVGSNGHIRFDEDNCHAQCSICNNHKSGNLSEYEPNLLKKIGKEKLAKLKVKFTKNWTIDELKAIITKYTDKLKGK